MSYVYAVAMRSASVVPAQKRRRARPRGAGETGGRVRLPL